MPETPASLLEQLRRSPTPDHWNRFVELYAPVIHHWAVHTRLQDADAADLIQEVFRVLLQKLPQFEYNPALRFRAWLKQVVVNVWRAQTRRRRGVPLDSAGEVAVADPAEEFWETEYKRSVARRALQIMQRDFEPATWQACWAVVVEGRPAAEAAAELRLKVGAVYAARFRVLTRLRQELDGLLD